MRRERERRGGEGTNPEELVGAALASCYAMALSADHSEAGFTPEGVQVAARVHLSATEDGPSISRIDLDGDARVPRIDESTFQEHARGARRACPVARALAVPEIALPARHSG